MTAADLSRAVVADQHRPYTLLEEVKVEAKRGMLIVLASSIRTGSPTLRASLQTLEEPRDDPHCTTSIRVEVGQTALGWVRGSRTAVGMMEIPKGLKGPHIVVVRADQPGWLAKVVGVIL